MYITNMKENNILLDNTRVPALHTYFCRYVEIHEWTLKEMISPWWRCYLPLSRGGSIIYQDELIKLLPGTAYLIPPYTRFSTETTQIFYKAYSHFNFEYNAMSFTPGIYSFVPPEQLFTSINNIVSSTSDNKNWDFCLLMTELISIGILSIPKENISKLASGRRVETAVKLMKSNFAPSLSNAELAKSVNMHENSFVRYFHGKMGSAPQKYYTMLRMEYASVLLVSTRSSIEEIAAQCGFWDRNHFTKVFSRYWSCPPAEFRKRD